MGKWASSQSEDGRELMEDRLFRLLRATRTCSTMALCRCTCMIGSLSGLNFFHAAADWMGCLPVSRNSALRTSLMCGMSMQHKVVVPGIVAVRVQTFLFWTSNVAGNMAKYDSYHIGVLQ